MFDPMFDFVSDSMEKNGEFEAILRRIHAATGATTQVELAALLGIKRAGISEVKRRNCIPAGWYLKLFEKLRVNPGWLKKGEGPAYLDPDRLLPERAAGDFQSRADEDPLARPVAARVYSMRCEYIPGGKSPPLTPAGRITLPEPYVRPGIVVLAVDNNAFAPIAGKGAYVGIDISAAQAVENDAYAVFAPYEGLMLRRLARLEGGKGFVLKAGSPAYPEVCLSEEECRSRLLGRLAWVLRNM